MSSIKEKLRESLILLYENIGSLTLYHGSKNKIDTKLGFKEEFIKSGEGSNHFGWGFYFTSVKEIAIYYGRNNSTNINNRYITLAIDDFRITDIDKAIVHFSRTLPDLELFDKPQYNELLSFIRFLKIKKKEGETKLNDLLDTGYLYTVNIHNSKPNLLNWEEAVNPELLQKLKISNPIKGGELYKLISTKLGSDQKASEFLYKNNYYGIIYPIEGNSNDKGHNYVIFNQSDIKITNEEKL